MQIKHVEFSGLDALQLETTELCMIVVTGMGPRIAYWGRQGGENLLYWQRDDIGRKGWLLLGGHRVWITRPGADESEDTYAADNQPCEVQQLENGVRVTGGCHPFLHVRRGIEIVQYSESSFAVTSFLLNEGPMLYSGGVWAPTCIDPSRGKEFAILIGDRQLTWDVVKIVIPRMFAGHTSLVADPQISWTEDYLVLRPTGIESKRMVMAPHGMLAMTWPEQGLSFVKQSQYHPRGNYPFGCNLALYVGPDNFMVEMESYGIQETVLPQQTIYLEERWTLADTVLHWQDPDELLAVVS